MWYYMDADGIQIKLQIKDYKPSTNNNWDSKWCKCDFLFTSSDWLNYHIENSEVLLCREIEELVNSLNELLDNKLTTVRELGFIEPDFVFKLYPQRNLNDNPNCIYISPGYEMKDICLEWEIFFWHDGLTANYLTITLGREEIAGLRDYLALIMKQ